MVVHSYMKNLPSYEANSGADPNSDDDSLDEAPKGAAATTRLPTHTKRDLRVAELAREKIIAGSIVVRWVTNWLGHGGRRRRRGQRSSFVIVDQHVGLSFLVRRLLWIMYGGRCEF
jgi:hypothetical protein